MPKAIIFCADGTWNGSKDPESTSFVDDVTEVATEGQEGHCTNVLKLFGNLADVDRVNARDAAFVARFSREVHAVPQLQLHGGNDSHPVPSAVVVTEDGARGMPSPSDALSRQRIRRSDRKGQDFVGARGEARAMREPSGHGLALGIGHQGGGISDGLQHGRLLFQAQH